MLEKHQSGDRAAIRVREDAERRRLWVLTLGELYLYDTAKLELIRKIELPKWSVGDFGLMCPPDVAVDRRGAVLVSNNIESRVLQLDPVNFAKREQHLAVKSKRQAEIGFGALTFAPDGTLFALSAFSGGLFKVDIASGAATEIALTKPVLNACALSYLGQQHPRAQPRVVSLCVGRGEHTRRVDLSADLARGLVTNEPCND